MATINQVTFKSDSSQLRKDLDSIKSKTRDVGSAFAGLKSAIAGIAIGAFVKEVVAGAAEISKLASSTGIAAQTIRGFQLAMIDSGGSATLATDAIKDLNKNIGDAALGSGELQKAFGLAGVSLTDLATLSNQDILAKTIAGLANINDGATRSAVAMKIFGESVRTTDFANLNANMARFTAESAGFGAQSKLAAEAQANLQIALARVADGVLLALGPILRFIASIEDLGAKVSAVLQAGLKIGAFLASWTLFGKVSGVIIGVLGRLGTIGASLEGTFLSISLWFAKMGKAGGLFGDVLAWIGLRFGALTKLAQPVTNFFASTWGWLTQIGVAAAGALGIDKLVEAFSDQAKAADGAAAATEKLKAQGELERQVLDAQAEKTKQLAAALRDQTRAINETVDAYKKSIAEAENKFRIDTANIGLSAKQRQLNDLIYSSESAYLSEISKLKQELNKQTELAAAGDTNAVKIIPLLKQAMDDLTKSYGEQVGKLTELTDARSAAEAARELELFATRQQIEQQNKLQSVIDDTAKLSMSQLEKKYYDIAAAARDSAKAAIEAEEARRGSPLSTAEIENYYKIANKGVEELKARTKEHYEQSRRWNTGWKQALNEYVDNVGNAANRAKDLFSTATKGMEDALVNFAKTGKLSFRSLISDILEQLLRSQIQQVIAQTFKLPALSGGGGGGGLLSSIGSLLGFANGGIIPTNGPVLVGERGPEILAGAAGRQVIPNNQLGGSTVNYNINAVDAQSFTALLARDPGLIHALAQQGGKQFARR